MGDFTLANLGSRTFVMKLLQLVFCLIILLVFRLGSSGDMILWGPGPTQARYPAPASTPVYSERSENDLILGLLVSPGYLFITLLLLIGAALGDSGKYTLCLFNLCGFLLHLAAGAVEVRAARRAEAGGVTGLAPSFGLGSICLITSFLFMVDSVWTAMDLFVRKPLDK